MKVLLDTCILSELRKDPINPKLNELFATLDEAHLFMSVVTLGELVKGISLLDDGRRKRELLSWIASLEKNFSERILAIDEDTAHIWGEITAKCQKNGKIITACDGLIAATALQHGLHLLTCNTSHFTPTGVLLLSI